MSHTVKATLTRCREKKPLVVLDSEPFNGMEIRPADLLALAQQLTEIAKWASAIETKAKHFAPTKVQLSPGTGMEDFAWRLLDKQPNR